MEALIIILNIIFIKLSNILFTSILFCLLPIIGNIIGRTFKRKVDRYWHSPVFQFCGDSEVPG